MDRNSCLGYSLDRVCIDSAASYPRSIPNTYTCSCAGTWSSFPPFFWHTVCISGFTFLCNPWPVRQVTFLFGTQPEYRQEIRIHTVYQTMPFWLFPFLIWYTGWTTPLSFYSHCIPNNALSAVSSSCLVHSLNTGRGFLSTLYTKQYLFGCLFFMFGIQDEQRSCLFVHTVCQTMPFLLFLFHVWYTGWTALLSFYSHCIPKFPCVC